MISSDILLIEDNPSDAELVIHVIYKSIFPAYYTLRSGNSGRRILSLKKELVSAKPAIS